MPPYEAFLSGDNLKQFWDYVKWFVFLGAPGLAILLATDTVERVVTMIKDSFEGKSKDDDDDDDVYYY
jgi:hypothetical protein